MIFLTLHLKFNGRHLMLILCWLIIINETSDLANN